MKYTKMKKFSLIIFMVWLGCASSFAETIDEVAFLNHRKKVEMQIESDLKEELIKIDSLKIIPLPFYEIKANQFGKISLTLDTANCFGILLSDTTIIGYALKENSTHYKISFFESDKPQINMSYSKYPYPPDTIIIANRKVPIELPSQRKMNEVLKSDSVKIRFGKTVSFKEILNAATQYGENLFWIYTFHPVERTGFGYLKEETLFFVSFKNFSVPVVFFDKKDFLKNQYPTMRYYRSIKKIWGK